jgi:hypothetical protein
VGTFRSFWDAIIGKPDGVAAAAPLGMWPPMNILAHMTTSTRPNPHNTADFCGEAFSRLPSFSDQDDALAWFTTHPSE